MSEIVFLLSRLCLGSDVASCQTSAVRRGDDLVINGQKMWITNAFQVGMDLLHEFLQFWTYLLGTIYLTFWETLNLLRFISHFRKSQVYRNDICYIVTFFQIYHDILHIKFGKGCIHYDIIYVTFWEKLFLL